MGSQYKPLLYHNTAISWPFSDTFHYSSFFSSFFLPVSCHYLPLLTPLCRGPLMPLFAVFSFPPSLSSVDLRSTLAVEIKVIKDLPWPPPVGQLNTSPPLVEELESPSQAAQPSPGQTSCDLHHHGGCRPASFPPISLISIRSSINPSPIHLIPLMWSYVVNYWFVCLSDFIQEQFDWWRVCMPSLNQYLHTHFCQSPAISKGGIYKKKN